MFIFETNLDSLDGRAKLANATFKFIYQKNNGDLDLCIPEVKTYYSHLQEYVRNIYELVDSQIPIVAYMELVTYGKDNYGITDQEFQDSISSAKTACELYYSEPIDKGNFSQYQKISNQETESTQTKSEEFTDACRSLMKYLNDNHHPHVSVIVTPTGAELLEGLICTGKIYDYVKD